MHCDKQRPIFKQVSFQRNADLSDGSFKSFSVITRNARSYSPPFLEGGGRNGVIGTSFFCTAAVGSVKVKTVGNPFDSGIKHKNDHLKLADRPDCVWEYMETMQYLDADQMGLPGLPQEVKNHTTFHVRHLLWDDKQDISEQSHKLQCKCNRLELYMRQICCVGEAG